LSHEHAINVRGVRIRVVVDDDVGAFECQAQRDCPADTTRGARDQDRLILESARYLIGHVSLRPPRAARALRPRVAAQAHGLRGLARKKQR